MAITEKETTNLMDLLKTPVEKQKDVQSVELDQVFAMQFCSDLRRGLFYTLICSQRPNSHVGKNSRNFPVLGSALAAWSRAKWAVTQ